MYITKRLGCIVGLHWYRPSYQMCYDKRDYVHIASKPFRFFKCHMYQCDICGKKTNPISHLKVEEFERGLGNRFGWGWKI